MKQEQNATKMKYTVCVLFGEQLVSSFQEDDILPKESDIIAQDGMLVTRAFETEAEKNAYLQALTDMDGWYAYHVITDIDTLLDQQWEQLDFTEMEIVTGIEQGSMSDQEFTKACDKCWKEKTVKEKLAIYNH